MSYSSIATAAGDPALVVRVRAAAVQEAWAPAQAANEYARQVRLSAYNGDLLVWPTCTTSDVEAAYESALAAGNPNPGGDPAVVTDGMILANVQAKWPPDPS